MSDIIHQGRPPHEPTAERRNVVQVMHANGIPIRIIAKALSIDAKTLRKWYRADLRDASLEVEASMGAAIVKAGQDGAWGAAKYWLVSHSSDARWRVPERHMIGGDPEAPPVRVDVSEMTDADIHRELDEIREQRRIADGARALAKGVPKRSNGVGH